MFAFPEIKLASGQFSKHCSSKDLPLAGLALDFPFPDLRGILLHVVCVPTEREFVSAGGEDEFPSPHCNTLVCPIPPNLLRGMLVPA